MSTCNHCPGPQRGEPFCPCMMRKEAERGWQPEAEQAREEAHTMTDHTALISSLEKATEGSREFNGAALGKRIKLLRALRRMSLDEVGQAAGLTKSHVWELEQGRSRNPTVNAVWGLARALSVSPAAILGLDDQMPPIHPLALEIAGMVDRALQHQGGGNHG